MSSTMTLKNANKLIEERNPLLEALLNVKIYFILNLLNERNNLTTNILSSLTNLSESEINIIIDKLERLDLVTRINENIQISSLAKKRIIYRAASLDFLIGNIITGDPSLSSPLRNTYTIQSLIGKGATSYTFCAIQSGTHRERTVKIFFPSTLKYEKLDDALRKRSRIKNDALPEIIDVGQIILRYPDGKSDIAPVVVLEYINAGAKTFSEFLNEQQNLNSTIFEKFIQQVGGALASIEDAGLIHGDLHEGNILVIPGKSSAIARDFRVIDFIGVPSSSSPELDVSSDMENFRNHLLRAAITACETYPGYSARLLLGERVFRILGNLRDNAYSTFKDMLQDFERPASTIPCEHFHAPAPEPFEWLRVEWIRTPEWLYKLFVPVPSRFDTIRRFGNTWISGPRGCGKSHYIRVLAFHPHVIVKSYSDSELLHNLNEIDYDFKKSFGVLFTCRLGEFKGFTPDAIGLQKFDFATQQFLKHILVLKLWNKTLNTIKEGLDTSDPTTNKSIIAAPHEYDEFISFLERRLGPMAIVDSEDPKSVFLQCLAMCNARENSSISVWHTAEKRSDQYLLNEDDLDKFFGVLKNTFNDLSDTRFLILVDDASDGNIHQEMQKILNSLVRSIQANHCFKITFDKHKYTLDTADGRSIDPTHEVTYVDLGEISTKSQRETVHNLSKYMADVVDKRLAAAGYKFSIQEILGRSQDARDFFSALSSPRSRLLKKSVRGKHILQRHKAYYAGWNIVWSIAHGSVRTLLELIEHIFNSNNVTHKISNISLKDQDTAVRSYSNLRYKALNMLPGEYDKEPLGQRLQSIISAIGQMSEQYLRHYNTGDENRWYETISIERLDREILDDNAQKLLLELIMHGLLLDEGVTFSRAQFGLCQRFDMNKIFAPAFNTTYRVRNHLYLSHQRLEELLLKPSAFVKRHRNKLASLADKTKQTTLFSQDS